MKKAYINPEMEIVKVATVQMLAASDGQVDVDGDSPITDGDKIGARRFGGFFDDEDEE